jgi:hypothetical protein
MSPSTDQRENREFAAEIKFLLSPTLAARVGEWARQRLAPDPHAAGDTGGAYQITSLYFDTAELDVFHRRGSYGRSKYRIRRYGSSVTVFLERKLKTRGLVTKRRSLVPVDELLQLPGRVAKPGWTGWWFHRRLLARGLEPVCQIGYQRTARVAMTPRGPIRLTLDRNVRAAAIADPGFDDGWPGVPVLDDQVILELKFRHETPLLFKRLVEEFALMPRPISKYRLAAAALGLVKEPLPCPANRIIQFAPEAAYA